MITICNIYRDRGVWCYAAWAGNEYDHSDTMDDCESESDARREAGTMFPAAVIGRANDVATWPESAVAE